MSRPIDLPDPETMSVEELRAEVIGGRDAFDDLVERGKRQRAEIRKLRTELEAAFRQIRGGPCGQCLSTWGTEHKSSATEEGSDGE